MEVSSGGILAFQDVEGFPWAGICPESAAWVVQSGYGAFCLAKALSSDLPGGVADWEDAVESEFLDPGPEGNKELSWAAEAVDVVMGVWGFMEIENGYLGLAPRNTQPRDLIYVLKGAAYSVALRLVGDRYVHIGTC